MIDINGVLISDNMYLEGIETSTYAVYDQKRSLSGEADITVFPVSGGRQFYLGTQNKNGAIQGMWCKSTIDQLNELRKLGTPLSLNYHGSIYSIYITSTEELTPLHQFEAEGPNKKFIGRIAVIESN